MTKNEFNRQILRDSGILLNQQGTSQIEVGVCERKREREKEGERERERGEREGEDMGGRQILGRRPNWKDIKEFEPSKVCEQESDMVRTVFWSRAQIRVKR